MSDHGDYWFFATVGLLVGLLAGILFTVWIINVTHGDYYSGQVDALTGHVRLHLVTAPDSTRTWEYIK